MLHEHVAEIQRTPDVRAVNLAQEVHHHSCAVDHREVTLLVGLVLDGNLDLLLALAACRVIRNFPHAVNYLIESALIIHLERVIKAVILKPQRYY